MNEGADRVRGRWEMRGCKEGEGRKIGKKGGRVKEENPRREEGDMGEVRGKEGREAYPSPVHPLMNTHADTDYTLLLDAVLWVP